MVVVTSTRPDGILPVAVQFRFLVSGASRLREEEGREVEVVDRCNLTVLEEQGQEDLADFLAQHKVGAGSAHRQAGRQAGQGRAGG